MPTLKSKDGSSTLIELSDEMVKVRSKGRVNFSFMEIVSV